jgi:signal transduction histidine kinase
VQITLEKTDTHAIIKVQDQGIGIAEKDLERIFNRFERVDSGDTIGGLGLGLYITKKTVEAKGGTIEVSSTLGVGTTFTVSLPLVVKS